MGTHPRIHQFFTPTVSISLQKQQKPLKLRLPFGVIEVDDFADKVGGIVARISSESLIIPKVCLRACSERSNRGLFTNRGVFEFFYEYK
jgi:hypothetical protein